jgi:CheY-like chemotaxis protein
MKILYVEDDPASRKLIQKGLGAEGIDVVVAEDGPKAIEMLRRIPFDALILDVMMPGIDGLQVGKVARREAVNPELPIVLLTAHPYALRESGAKWLKPVASLTKPAKLDKLVRILREAVPSPTKE